ncbi:HTH_Tnp_Tc3_2 domain-containing protein [Trichonephila clavipes]|nr:HTH_Tnp_Tc3_2 domain-containing protein [Trichonephila clavipes]
MTVKTSNFRVAVKRPETQHQKVKKGRGGFISEIGKHVSKNSLTFGNQSESSHLALSQGKKLFKTHHPDNAQKPRLPDPIIQPIAVMPPSRTKPPLSPCPSSKTCPEMGLRTVFTVQKPKKATPEESFFHLFLCVMGKAADLSDFDRGQIVMARRLGTSISETARLVSCSRSTVVSTYAKWMNDGDISSRRHGVGRLHAIKEKGHQRLSRMVKQNQWLS